MENGDGEQKELNWHNLPPIAKRALKIVATNQNFVTYKINIESGSKVGDGYMSVIVRATIIGTKAESKNVTHEFPVLCKMQVVSKSRREFSNSNELFKREIALYNEYLPELVKLQQEYGISEKDGFFNFPTCYYGEFDEENDDAIIVMRDIRDQGYKMVSKYEPLDIAVCELVVRELGKLHAMSFALERKRPEIFSKFKDYQDVMHKIMLQPATNQFWDTVFPTALNSLHDNYPVVKEKIEKLRDNLEEEFLYLIDDKNSGKYSVMGHGDSWSNNFLFTFDPKGKPENIKVLDWQLSRYGSPILDLAYFLFTATDKNIRDKHYKNLLKLYHDSLSTLLQKFGESADEVFPYEDFIKEWPKFGRYGLLMSLCIVQFTTVSPEDLQDLDKSMDDFMNPDAKKDGKSAMMKAAEANSKRLEPRIRDIVLDMDRFGYI